MLTWPKGRIPYRELAHVQKDMRVHGHGMVSHGMAWAGLGIVWASYGIPRVQLPLLVGRDGAHDGS